MIQKKERIKEFIENKGFKQTKAESDYQTMFEVRNGRSLGRFRRFGGLKLTHSSNSVHDIRRYSSESSDFSSW